MDKLFWVIPGKLAGRPGPDQAPWDLAALRVGGIGTILSVNDGLLCHPQDFAVAGINYACMPLSANARHTLEMSRSACASCPKHTRSSKHRWGRGVGSWCTARGAKI